MGLFDIIGFAAEKIHKKYKDSKMESAMDSLLSVLDTCSLNLEVIPYNSNEDPYTIKGRIYKMGTNEINKSSATYFLTTNSWLKKAGVDIDNDDIYQAAFNEKAGYAVIKLSKKYPDITKNYGNTYNSKSVVTSLIVYLNESNRMLAMPKFVMDKDKSVKLSKKASIEDLSQIENMGRDPFANNDEKFKNFYVRAKAFAYLAVKELNSYNKDDLDAAFKQFEEKHGKNAEVSYSF